MSYKIEYGQLNRIEIQHFEYKNFQSFISEGANILIKSGGRKKRRVYLMTWRFKFDGFNSCDNEIFISSESSQLFNRLMDLSIDNRAGEITEVNVLFIQEYSTWEGAYKSALLMREGSNIEVYDNA